MNFIKRLIQIIFSIRYKYLLMGSVVIVEKGSELKVGNGCKIRQSKIVVKGNYRINMEDNCIISHSSLAFYSINGLRESHIGTHTSFYGVQLQAYGSFKCGGWNILSRKIILRCLPFLMEAWISDIIIVL